MGKKEIQIQTKKNRFGWRGDWKYSLEDYKINIGYKAVDYTDRHSLLVNNNREGLEQWMFEYKDSSFSLEEESKPRA